MIGSFRLAVLLSVVLVAGLSASAQSSLQNPGTPKKANARPTASPTPKAEPFENASLEQMTGQCVTLETEQGAIILEMLPDKAPQTVRSFLNLVASGALDTTTFSRVVRGFVIQGGNLSTSERWGPNLAARMQRTLPDEPNDVKHLRGVVSMARSDEPSTATTHFFILIGNGPHLDGKFAAFGKVTSGMEVVDAISRGELEGENPIVPVRIKRATVAGCGK